MSLATRPRRLLITGWRHYPLARRAIVVDALDQHLATLWPLTLPIVVVHGAAPGADAIAHQWASACEYATPEAHPAAWELCGPTCPPGHQRRRPNSTGTYCPTAGPRRNAAMVAAGADWCLAFPGPTRGGTHDCIDRARAAGIHVDVHPWTPEPAQPRKDPQP